jgi:hypothetical protein
MHYSNNDDAILCCRYDSIVGCEYSHRHHEPPHMLDCEHVLFHECMIQKNKARIFSNSNMYVCHINELIFLAVISPSNDLMQLS